MVSSLVTVLGISLLSPVAVIAAVMARRIACGQQRTKDRLHEGAAQVALQVGRARRHAHARDRHRGRQRARGRRAGEADADADKGIAQPDHPVGDALVPQQEHGDEAEQDEEVAGQQREAGAARLDQLGRARGDEDHEEGGGQNGKAGGDRRVAKHILQELLADEHGAHQRAHDDDAAHRRHPEGGSGGDLEVVERVLRRGAAG